MHPLSARAEATADTKEIAGAVLGELKKEGKDPAKDQINLSVWAQQDAGKGMTGKPLTRPFGRTVYNHKSDSIGIPPVAAEVTSAPKAVCESACAPTPIGARSH